VALVTSCSDPFRPDRSLPLGEPFLKAKAEKRLLKIKEDRSDAIEALGQVGVTDGSGSEDF